MIPKIAPGKIAPNIAATNNRHAMFFVAVLTIAPISVGASDSIPDLGNTSRPLNDASGERSRPSFLTIYFPNASESSRKSFKGPVYEAADLLLQFFRRSKAL